MTDGGGFGITKLFSSLSDNPYFGAGFGLASLGVFLASAKRGSKYAWLYARRRYLVSLEITSRDKSYQWFLKWMSQNVKETQHLSLETSFVRHDNGTVQTNFAFLPNVGTHFFKYKSMWLKVTREREKTALDLHSGGMWENVTLTTFQHYKPLLFELLGDAKRMALQEEEGKTIVYTSYGFEWRQFGYPRRRRPLSSVILRDNLSRFILNDVQDFLRNPKWYVDKGIPYRRGYLLHGPPGCGKSSFIQALAGELQHNICILSLSDKSLTDDRLNHLLTVAPEKSLILLEDVDAAFRDRYERETYLENIPDKYNYQALPNNITFSGLLNALDGVAAGEGRILFMTTNFVERLDKALIRPGRVDVICELGPATKEQIESLFLKFFPTATPEQVFQFSSRVPPMMLSMAHLQGYFLLHKDGVESALNDIDGWVNSTTVSYTHLTLPTIYSV
eukprot:TRINITY_DN232_c0_g3_i1.p1 TRINITY_DN232_c0_g3~~TRINITY_DN232_c0_g3_i1.p1  ORF type:complete len:448 (+),score=57.08 TRINITY_DN232_c0_g3_i1:50-1393(+)